SMDLQLAASLAESLPDADPEREKLSEEIRLKRQEERDEKRRKIIALGDFIARRAFGATPEERPEKVLELRDAVEGYLSGKSRRRESHQISEEIGEALDNAGADGSE